jgi:hypothetical protein
VIKKNSRFFQIKMHNMKVLKFMNFWLPMHKKYKTSLRYVQKQAKQEQLIVGFCFKQSD